MLQESFKLQCKHICEGALYSMAHSEPPNLWNHSCALLCLMCLNNDIWPLTSGAVWGQEFTLPCGSYTCLPQYCETVCVCVCVRERARSYFPWVRKETDESMLWVWVMGTITPQNTLNQKCAHTVIHIPALRQEVLHGWAPLTLY